MPFVIDDLPVRRSPAPPEVPLAQPLILLPTSVPIAQPVSAAPSPAPILDVTASPSPGQASALSERSKVPFSAIDTAIRTLTLNSTAPSVAGGNVFRTANTAATAISNFIDGASGQEITVIFGDSNTSVSSTSASFAIPSTMASTPNDTINLVNDAGVWFQVGRSVN